MHLLYARINTGLLVFIALTGVVLVTMMAGRAYGGPLDPPAPPASTLPQVEPRSPIPPVGWDGTSAITIPSSGSYLLTRNLTAIPITIGAEKVTFDLNGFTLDGAGSPIGINATTGNKRNIVIRNGTLLGWQSFAITLVQVTRSTLSDLDISGSGTGIRIDSGNTIIRVRSHNNVADGLLLQSVGDSGGSIEASNFSQNGDNGIRLGNNTTVHDSVMDGNTNCGAYLNGSWNDVTDSRMVGNAYGVCFAAGNRNVAVRNHIDGNTTAPSFDTGAGNIFGPIAQTGGGAAANIGFP